MLIDFEGVEESENTQAHSLIFWPKETLISEVKSMNSKNPLISLKFDGFMALVNVFTILDLSNAFYIPFLSSFIKEPLT